VPTELVWDGKYKDGKKSSPLRISLPFQDVETVNESAQERQKMLDLFSSGRPTDWRNRLIWGDKRYVLPSLLDEFAGKVNLIYIDPPFDTGADFSYQVSIEDENFTKEPSLIEQKAYRDTWGRGLDSYLQWFYEAVVLLRELLADNGSIYVHVDWHVGNYVKAVMDEVFGPSNFQNEITWQRTSAHANVSQRYGAVYDRILYYTASDKFTWNQQYAPYTADYIDMFFDQKESTGRRYARRDLTASMTRASTGQIYTWKGITPLSSRCWAMTKGKMDDLDAAGRIHWPKKAGGMPRLKLYPEDLPGIPLQDLWTDVRPLHNLSAERVDYPTQKPETLLNRIIKTSSNEGDLILDCFAGSGTTVSVAEKLGRRWITCDLGRFAVHTTRKRLLGIQGVKPFVVQNLGKYERQLWQADEFGPQANQRIAAYTEFILNLYHSQPLAGRRPSVTEAAAKCKVRSGETALTWGALPQNCSYAWAKTSSEACAWASFLAHLVVQPLANASMGFQAQHRRLDRARQTPPSSASVGDGRNPSLVGVHRLGVGVADACKHVLRDLLVESYPADLRRKSPRVVGELGPVAEVAVGEVFIDAPDQCGRHPFVDRVIDRDDLQDLVARERREAQILVDARGEHRLLTQHLETAGASDKQKSELRARVVVKISEVFQALAVEPLRLVDDQQAKTLRQRGLEDAVSLHRAVGNLFAEAEVGVQLVT